MNNKNGAKKRVIQILSEVGPLCSAEIAEQAEWSDSYARAAVSYCRTLWPKQIYIKEYLRSEEFARCYPRAVYAIGDLPDAKKPQPFSHAVYNQRHRNKKTTQVASIFTIAQPLDKRRLTTKKRPDVAERLRNRPDNGMGEAEA